jgi:Resolvase, N terminal domain
VPPELRKRFKAALALLEAGESEALIFTKVDRASRCTEDFARLIHLSEEQGWRLIVTEMGIDTHADRQGDGAHGVWPTCAYVRIGVGCCYGPEHEASGLSGLREKNSRHAVRASPRRVRIGVGTRRKILGAGSGHALLRSDGMPSVDHGSTSHTVMAAAWTAVQLMWPTVPVVCPGGFDFTGVQALRFG